MTDHIRVKFGPDPYAQEFTCAHCGRTFSRGGFFLRVEEQDNIVDVPVCPDCHDAGLLFEGRLDTRHCINSTSKTFHGDQWVAAEAVVHGVSVVRHLVNGEEVLSYELSQMGGGSVANHDLAVWTDGQLIEEGSISLQAESHPLEFRNVELLPLVGCTDPKAKNYKAYYVKPALGRCKYA